MKLFIILLAAAVTVAGVAQAARNHGRIDEPAAGDRTTIKAGDRLAMSMGRPKSIV